MKKINRREFLKAAASAAAAAAVPPGCVSMGPDRLEFKKRKEGILIKNATIISMKKGSRP